VRKAPLRSRSRDPHEDRDVGFSMRQLCEYDQMDLFKQTADGVANRRDVPRARRAHKGRVTPGER